MSIKKMLLADKMLEICESCHFDLRDIKEYLRNTYNLSPKVDLSKEMREFKALIAKKFKSNKWNLIEEFKEKFMKEECYDNKSME